MSIPLEQFAMTCQTLRDARVLELSEQLHQAQQWHIELKYPHLTLTEGYSMEMYLGKQYVHRVRIPFMPKEQLQNFKAFIDTAPTKFFYLDQDYVMQIEGDQVTFVNTQIGAVVPLNVILPVLQQIIQHMQTV